MSLLLTFPDAKVADGVDERMRDILGKAPVKWSLERIADRPPMKDRKANSRVLKSLRTIADEWEIPLNTESSVWPSAAGLVVDTSSVVCGMGPVGHHLHTPQEAVQRISLMQRTLLIARFLAKDL